MHITYHCLRPPKFYLHVHCHFFYANVTFIAECLHNIGPVLTGQAGLPSCLAAMLLHWTLVTVSAVPTVLPPSSLSLRSGSYLPPPPPLHWATTTTTQAALIATASIPSDLRNDIGFRERSVFNMA